MENKQLFNKFLSLKKIKDEESLRISLYGYSSEIILSKELFTNNKELVEFISLLGLEFRDYVYASRTVVISRIIRDLQKRDMAQLEKYRDSIIEFYKNKFDFYVLPSTSGAKNTDKTGNYVKTIVERYKRDQ
ncbi:hypothetical protein CN283_29880 [Bacillus thuringiensis]|uniref:hypothetical protein n=1 Tax=Bacillus thuringiensis TaxID=1428 RepID=UPI000BF28FFC|nr:hypothetical protein [Bacillus thuringiensis]PFB77514.1 hypothetical protein CN283_29880 [Bacillus thuringiensis]